MEEDEGRKDRGQVRRTKTDLSKGIKGEKRKKKKGHTVWER